MKVLLLAKYDQAGASSRYRTLQYLAYLKERNIHVTVDSLLNSHHIKKIFAKKRPSFLYYLIRYIKRAYVLLFKKRQFDVCWIEGELFPYLPFFLEKFFLPKKYITEYDDAIFHNYNMHRMKFVRYLLGNKIDKIMRRSMHVIVGNEYVKQHALSVGAKNVTILPTVVDADIYKPITEPKKENDTIIIGWLGSPPTVKYLSMIESLLIEITKKINIKLHVIGGEYQLKGIETECYHWPNDWSEKEEIALLNKIDIGIMPLINSPWEKGKCGFKLIKYMACAKPVIASPVSSNLDIVTHGVTGYLAETLIEWEKYLLLLTSSSDDRYQFGKKGRAKMIEQYSLQATAPILHRILSSADKLTV